MKTYFSPFRAVLTVCLVVFVCPLLVSEAYAGPPAAVKEAYSKPTILVTVPPGGQAVRYTLGNKVWLIKPGESAVLPAAATKISLPRGTILTVSYPSAKSMEPIKQSYTVNQPLVLDALTPGAIGANQGSFSPGGQIPGPDGTISLPPGEIVDLINAVLNINGRTVNPFNVLGEGVTDSN